MRTTTLGSAGPEVGVIGLGCMGMTYRYDMKTPRDEATSISVIHQALDLGRTSELPFHLRRALDYGVSKDDLIELITHLAFYAGWPNAMSATSAAKDAFEG